MNIFPLIWGKTLALSEPYSELCQTSKMFFTEIVNFFYNQLNVLLVSECTSGYDLVILGVRELFTGVLLSNFTKSKLHHNCFCWSFPKFLEQLFLAVRKMYQNRGLP